MQICIVDDEKECRDTLMAILEQYSQEKAVPISCHVFADAKSFLSAYKKGLYDIIFLDIYIDSMTGMDLAEHIRKQTDREMIIFCTTSLEDMPQAFRFHAFEYIIKPATYERVEKVLLDATAILPKAEAFVEFSAGKETVRIRVGDIRCVTTQGHYLEIDTGASMLLRTRLTLKEFLEKVASYNQFLSINKGIVVNMDYIKSIEDKNCLLKDGQTLPVKVRDSVKIRTMWQDYSFEKIRSGQGEVK